MVYGSEAILPTDLDYGAPRVKAYNEQGNEASLEDAVDLLVTPRSWGQQGIAWLHFFPVYVG